MGSYFSTPIKYYYISDEVHEDGYEICNNNIIENKHNEPKKYMEAHYGNNEVFYTIIEINVRNLYNNYIYDVVLSDDVDTTMISKCFDSIVVDKFKVTNRRDMTDPSTIHDLGLIINPSIIYSDNLTNLYDYVYNNSKIYGTNLSI